MTAVRVRGIYATALTRRLLDAGHAVVDASPPIQRRFGDELESTDAAGAVAPSDDGAAEPSDDGAAGSDAVAVTIETTADRQGVELSGDPEPVAAIREELADVAIDALSWPDPAPLGAVCNAVVSTTRGGGAVLDLPGGATGYLSFDDADGYVDVGDRLRVQVTDPSPPWDDFDSRVSTDVQIERALLTLDRGAEGIRVDARGEDATALARTTELLDASPPAGWGLRWHRSAVDAGHGTLATELERAADTAADVEASLADAPSPDDAAPRLIATPAATSWLWFGRTARFALDDVRGRVTTTIPGHHRIKAADDSASLGVDLAEAITGATGNSHSSDDGATDDGFPFDAVATQLGPADGDHVAIQHGKPDGSLYSLGRAEITDYDPDGGLTVRREMQGSGTYDALGTARERGDTAVTKLQEGRWWYPTTYRGTDGERKGTYVNVCTPVELFPDAVRYVDLHVDVIDPPEGDVQVVDEDELAGAVEAGHVSEALAERARAVAETVRRALAD